MERSVSFRRRDPFRDDEVEPNRGADIEDALLMPFQWRMFFGHPYLPHGTTPNIFFMPRTYARPMVRLDGRHGHQEIRVQHSPGEQFGNTDAGMYPCPGEALEVILVLYLSRCDRMLRNLSQRESESV